MAQFSASELKYILKESTFWSDLISEIIEIRGVWGFCGGGVLRVFWGGYFCLILFLMEKKLRWNLSFWNDKILCLIFGTSSCVSGLS